MDFFAEARMHMVECQIRTNAVIDEGVLQSFENTQRENFVPAALKSIAYTDKPLALAHGRYLMDPMVHAKLLQALTLKSSDVALTIGDASGYISATLSPLVSTVLALETRQDTIDRAVKALDENGINNVVYVKGKLDQGLEDHAPFDVILFTGAIAYMPEDVLDQLSEGGRLAAVIKENDLDSGRAVLFTKLDNGRVQSRILFDASLPYLQSLTPEEEFVF